MAAIHHNSSDFEPISNPTLPPAQAQVIAALAQGRSVTAAALEAGLHRTTIHSWLRHEPAFKTAVESARREYAGALNDQMRDLSARALEILRNLLDDPNTPAAIRLKAALAVLQRPRFPHPGWNLPERIESPQEQQFIDGLAEIEEEYRVMRMTTAQDAKPQQAEPAAASPVARNSPCPCGSGRKYKRCCANAGPGVVHSVAAAPGEQGPHVLRSTTDAGRILALTR